MSSTIQNSLRPVNNQATSTAASNENNSDYDALSQDSARDARTGTEVESRFLSRLTQNPEKFKLALRQAFGDKATDSRINDLVQRLLADGLPRPSDIRFVDAASLGTDVFGAFVDENGGTLLLDRRLITNEEKLLDVFTEEYGHFLDAYLGGEDSAGDEGAVFSLVLRSMTSVPDQQNIAQLQSQNDFARIAVEGRHVFAELYQEAASDTTTYHGESSATDGQIKARDDAVNALATDYRSELAAARSDQGGIGWSYTEIPNGDSVAEFVWRFSDDKFHEWYWEQSGEALANLANVLGLSSIAELRNFDPRIISTALADDRTRYYTWAPGNTALLDQSKLDYQDLILSRPLAQELIQRQSTASVVMDSPQALRMISLYGRERYETMQRYQLGVQQAKGEFENAATAAARIGALTDAERSRFDTSDDVVVDPGLRAPAATMAQPEWNGEAVGTFRTNDQAPDGWGWRVEIAHQDVLDDEGLLVIGTTQKMQWNWVFDAQAFHASYIQGDSTSARYMDSYGSVEWSNTLHRVDVVLTEGSDNGGDVHEKHNVQYSGTALGGYHKIDVGADGQVAVLRQDDLVLIDPGGPGLHVYNPSAIEFDDLEGFVTVHDNIVRPRTDFDRFADIVMVAGVTYMSIVTGGAASKMAWGAVGGAMASSAFNYLAMNAVTGGEITLKGFLRTVLISAVTAYVGKLTGDGTSISGASNIDADTVRRALIRGGLRGAINDLSGGKFGDGFVQGASSEFLNDMMADLKLTYNDVPDIAWRPLRVLIETSLTDGDPQQAMASGLLNDIYSMEQGAGQPVAPENRLTPDSNYDTGGALYESETEIEVREALEQEQRDTAIENPAPPDPSWSTGGELMDDEIGTPVVVEPGLPEVPGIAPVNVLDHNAATEMYNEQFSNQSLRNSIVRMVKGAGDDDLKAAMNRLQGVEDSSGAIVVAMTADEIEADLVTIANARSRPLVQIRAEYQRMRQLQESVQYSITNPENRVQRLDTDRHQNFMASTDQLRYGYMVGQVLEIDPVFGALLNPTGGIVGPGNSNVPLISARYTQQHFEGLDVVNPHGIAHDASGYLAVYHGVGSGYTYVPGARGDTPNLNPLSGQVSGVNFFADEIHRIVWGTPRDQFDGGP